MVNLKQLTTALQTLGVGRKHIDNAIEELEELLIDLESVPVSGRKSVDTMLGCMMAIDMIIGEEKENGR